MLRIVFASILSLVGSGIFGDALGQRDNSLVPVTAKSLATDFQSTLDALGQNADTLGLVRALQAHIAVSGADCGVVSQALEQLPDPADRERVKNQFSLIDVTRQNDAWNCEIMRRENARVATGVNGQGDAADSNRPIALFDTSLPGQTGKVAPPSSSGTGTADY